MIIDLHIHTQRLKKGDNKNRVISEDDLIDVLHNNNVKIAAITNHNKFDIDEFDYISDQEINFQLFPGIELDVEFENGIRHIVLIADPIISNKFSYHFDGDPSRIYDDYSISYQDFINIVKKFNLNEIIIIPHFLDKDKAVADSEWKQLTNDLEHSIILETSNLISMGMINSHNVLSLIGSDISDWSKYDSSKLPSLKFNINTFKSFYELSKDPSTFISKALSETHKTNIPLVEKWSPNGTNISVPIYNDINIFFGEKGSGKSILLEQNVYPHLLSEGFSVSYHSGANYEKLYNDLIKTYEDRININNNDKAEIRILFENIIGYTEPQIINQYSSYLKKHQSQKVSKNANRIKKTDSFYTNKSSKNDEQIFLKINNDINKIDIIMELSKEYEGQSDFSIDTLLNELTKFKNAVFNKNILVLKNNFVNEFTESFITNIKKLVQRKSMKEFVPNNLGFEKMVSDRLSRMKDNLNFLKKLSDIQVVEEQRFGILPDKGPINLKTEIKVLSPKEVHYAGSPFNRNTIKTNRAIIEKILGFNVSKFKEIKKYFEDDEKAINLYDFVDQIIVKESKFVINGNHSYDPSDGEKSILSISGKLENSSSDYYLFDEIERGLGNKYISEYLIPRLNELRDLGKTIIISTHNANVAINTLPSQWIYCNYSTDEDDVYYQGNMYSNNLTGLVTEKQFFWTKKAIEHLEGSEEMFKTRGNLYGIK